MDPDNQVKPAFTVPQLATPANGWQEISKVYGSADQVFGFTNAQLVTYFVTRTADDGLPLGDFKSINSSAEKLFCCGHVQNILVAEDTVDTFFLRADCLPEMRKDRIYNINMKLDKKTFDICGATCGCPAGKGPKASCKHIAATCHALQEFSKIKRVPDYQTCTERLQTWNQPRPRKLDPIPVDNLRMRKQELMPPKTWSSQLTREASVFDPRPPSLRLPDPRASERLRCGLMTLNQPCAFLHILVPDAQVINHDHCYSLDPSLVEVEKLITPVQTTSDDAEYVARILDDSTIVAFKERLRVSSGLRHQIEQSTRQQSSSMEWFSARAYRITSSICGQILMQKKRSVPLLTQILYRKPFFDPLPPPIAWGRQNESTALRKYEEFMNKNGHGGLTTEKCGFIIHPTSGWLGASPDAKVFDPSCKEVGIAEFKCPYTKRDMSPLEACADADFCGELVNSHFQLKRKHKYFHQVQLQLYVSRDMHSFCDFCVYTPVDVVVERIYPCKEWEETYIPQLEEYYDKYMLPEIINPLHKPGYFL